MKKVFILLMTVMAVSFSSCEGPQGPAGFDGLDGETIASSAFEIIVQFNSGNGYSFVEPYGFNVLQTDVTLVYILWDTVDGQDVWRLVPQSVQFDEGTLTYNFDFTQQVVRFFLDGTINFGLLGNEWTQNQVFRVVVVPADNVGRVDYSDINVVMDAYDITSFDKR
ncbi:MAG: hypothetical protein ACSHXF_12280 [Aquaticitalea sp.]